MPLQWTPLTPCDGNTPRKGHLSEFKRSRIIRIYNRGVKKAIISRYYNHLYSTVADTLEKKELYNNGHSLPRSGPAKYYTNIEERLML